MLKNIKKIVVVLVLFIICGTTKVIAEINDSSLTRNYYHGYYAVYNAPDRVRLFDAERFTLNGDTAYCIEPGIAITTNTYSSTSDWSITGLSADVRNYIRLVAYYGYDYPNHQTMYYYFATQELIWEKVSGRAVGWILGEDRYGPQLDIESQKNEILNLIDKHYETPSFDEKTYDLTLGESIEIEDSNNVLSNYELYSTSLENISIHGNKLVIGKQSSTNDGDIQLVKKYYTSKVNLIYYNGNTQKLVRYGVLDPVLSVVNINVIGGHVTIAKQDKETGNKTQGDAILNGAEYNIYNKENNLVDTLTIGIRETSIELPVGNYTIKESKAPKGYKIDNNTYYFTIDKNNVEINLDLYDEVIKVNYNIFKVYANENTVELTGEPNITFDFYLISNNTLIKSAITDETGHLSVDLPYGRYLVKQKNSTPNYEKVKDFEIDINEKTESIVNKLISDAEIKAKLKVIKVDSETGKIIAKEGIKFKIKNLDKNAYVCQEITYPTTKKICEYETDNTGTMITPYVLKAGNYQLEEVENQKVDGYVWNKTSLKFSINENSSFKSINNEIVLEIKFSNSQVKGSIELNKVGEKIVIKDNKLTYEEMSDVVFNLYANDDIYSQDGTKIYNKNDIVRTLTLKNGNVKTNNLYLGKYCLIETKTNDKYVLDNTPKCFEIKYKDQYTNNISLTFTYKNYLAKGSMELTKTDISTSEPLPNTKIEVYTEDAKLIFSDITNDKGKIIIENLPIGKYYFIEKEAPEGYVLNTEKHNFEIKDNGEIVKSTLTNEKIKGDFILTKTDISTSEPLPNTLIEIYNDKNELIYSDRTDEKGNIEIKDLEYGKYYFIEKEAPEGYVPNPNKMPFEINVNGEVIKSTLENKLIRGSIEFTKIDFSTSEPLPNTLIQIYNEIDELIFEDRTDENGKITIQELPYGKYYIVEKEAPEGYILNEEKMLFEIKEDGEVVKATMTNEKIIDVPNTLKNDYTDVVVYIVVGIGVVFIGYALFKSKKK